MSRINVAGIGNAMVDILAYCDERLVSSLRLHKGHMQLIDITRARELGTYLKPDTEVCGGSAANTVAVVAKLGSTAGYIGKVKDDHYGHVFAGDMKRQGIEYNTPLAPAEVPDETGRCIVMITPDGERTMNTYLGVTEFLSPTDIDIGLIGKSRWIYLEGYRFDGLDSQAAFARAVAMARAAGGRVSLTLSDPFCVERHRDAFLSIITESVDLLFCNRDELLSLYRTGDFDQALRAAANQVEMLACTDGAKGAVVAEAGHLSTVPTTPARVVDATGAGDAFAGGVLWGLTNGHGLPAAARIGNAVAGSVIGHVGPRPRANLGRLLSSGKVLA